MVRKPHDKFQDILTQIAELYWIRPLTEDDLEDVLLFADREIGKNYYHRDNFLPLMEKSRMHDLNASFVAVEKKTNRLVALRLSFAPGLWTADRPHHLSPTLWQRPVPLKQLAHFKSLFIAHDHRGKGLGPYLSRLSLSVLKQQGAVAVLSHSSLGSPGNSSQKYLTSLGFQSVKEHPHFWSHISYDCAHCNKKPCECSALEMILYLDDK
jgi:ribosomal protein S18 acetylase RimI-like enzyme